MHAIARNLFIDATMERNALAASNGWTVTRETETFLTVEREARWTENGYTTNRETQSLTVFSNGDVLLYVKDIAPYGNSSWQDTWTRERDIERITEIVSAPALHHTVEY